MSTHWGRELYVKLYRREHGSFAQLPWVTRACAAELLKIVDDDGRIFVGSKDLVDVVAFRMGATVGDRRIMREAFKRLFADRYLIADGDHVRVRNFTVAQRHRTQHDAALTPASGTHEPETNPARTNTDTGVSRARTQHEPETKTDTSARNYSGADGLLDKSRVEKNRVEEPSPPNPPPSGMEGGLPEVVVPPLPEPAPATVPSSPASLAVAALSRTEQGLAPRFRKALETFGEGKIYTATDPAVEVQLDDRLWMILQEFDNDESWLETVARFVGAGGARKQGKKPGLDWLIEKSGRNLRWLFDAAKEWQSKGRPAIGDKGEFAPLKPAVAAPAQPQAVRPKQGEHVLSAYAATARARREYAERQRLKAQQEAAAAADAATTPPIVAEAGNA